MKQIHYATTNKGKIVSMRRVMIPYDIEVLQVALELPEPRSDNVQLIARRKVLDAFDQIGKPCIALDAGFYIHSLNGFPKAFVNFALETVGLEGILTLVKGKSRSCEFRQTLAFYDDTIEEPTYFHGVFPGILAEDIRGASHERQWSALHHIFIPQGAKKTHAEMTEEEYCAFKSAQQNQPSYAEQFAVWYAKRSDETDNKE